MTSDIFIGTILAIDSNTELLDFVNNNIIWNQINDLKSRVIEYESKINKSCGLDSI